MCVVALALNAHPLWPVILAGNRDEYHARPSAPLARWDGAESHILAGRDLLSGGTWLGVSERGRLAVVTNIRTGALPDPDKRSRGDLVIDYLRGNPTPPQSQLGQYNGFSLLTLGAEGAQLNANLPYAVAASLPPGIHGLSNGLPDEEWPRKTRLLHLFAESIADLNATAEPLLDMLALESESDGLFIRDAIYGTRCSTVVLIGHDGAGTIVERQYASLAVAKETVSLPFRFA